MTSYFLRRILYAALTFFGVTVAVFVLIHAVPGDPVRYFIGESGLGGPGVPPEIIEQIRTEHHLDRSLPVQYGFWLRDVLLLDFGESFSARRPVRDLILEKLPRTIELNLIAMLVAMAIALPVGVRSGSRPGTRFDRGSAMISFILYSLPSFWVALILMELFAVKLQILPLVGMHSSGADEMSMVGRFVDHSRHLVLPVTTLAYAQFAIFTRFTRSSVLDVVGKDFITAARARGSGESTIVWRHALRSALIPLITVVGLMIPFLLSGSVIIERMFQWDGVGRLYFEAILARDYPVVMGLTVVTAIMTLLASLVTDLMYAAADPRVRFQEDPS